MTNIDKHIRYMHATVGYLRDQLQANPKVLQLGQETHTVASLASQCGDALKHLRGFSEEVKFLKCHLDKVIFFVYLILKEIIWLINKVVLMD